MYYLNKIVGFMASPLGGAIAGCVVVIVCAHIKRMRMAKLLGGLTVLWLWLWMTPLMTRVVGVPLENEFLDDGRVPNAESFPRADAIVLLGGGMGADASLSEYAEMWMSADRVWQAVRLWKSGKALRIIATGDRARESTLGLMKDFGVDGKCVSFLDARNTEEEAKGVCSEMKKKRDESGSFARTKVLLVTSAWHMKRARMMFEKYAEGIDAVCAPADFEMSMAVRKRLGWKMVLPDAYIFHLNSAAVHEWVGIIGYGVLR